MSIRDFPIRIRSGIAVVAIAMIAIASSSAQAADAPRKLQYNRDIRPILSDNCFACHGPDKNKRKAKLRLDLREEALSVEAFVPGKADESELVRRIFSKDDEEVMPPPEAHKTLTEAQ